MKNFLASLLLFSFLIVSLFACSSNDSTAPAPLPPSIVGMQLRADAGDKEVTLDWKMLADATSYNIYFGTTSSNLTRISTTPAVLIGPRYTVTSLTNGTKYYFALSAVNANGESDLSSIISAVPNAPPPPAAPTNIRANPGDKKVTVSWNVVPGASSYNLHCIDVLLGTSIITLSGSASPYVVNTVTWNVGTATETTAELQNGMPYPYIFRLMAETAESGSSTEVLATPGTASTDTELGGAAATTVTATVTAGTSNKVTISWDPLPSETPYTSYNLYYYPTSASSPTTRIPEFKNGSVVSGPTLTDGTSYSFYLTAVTASSASFLVTATPSATLPPAAPTLSSPTPGNGNVTLTWTAVTGATSYNIYWSTLPDVTKTVGAATIGLLPTPPPLTATVTLVNGTKYYFVVTAVNANGESMESNEVYTTPPSGPTGP
ncbi:MAG: fibronectin type III domain-containing protein [Smithella sp.]